MERIKKGDTVEVISGADKGKRGTVHDVLPGEARLTPGTPDRDRDRLVISGVRMIKKHQRRTGDVRTQVGIIEREAPIAASKALVVCKNCNKATRVGFRVFEDGSKARYCKKCGELID
jgi:large subunit ribosomal protein L24